MSVPGGFRRLPLKSGEDRNAAVLLDCGPREGTGSGPPRLLQTRRPSALSSLQGAARAYTSRLREDVAARRHHTRLRSGLQHHPNVPRDRITPMCVRAVLWAERLRCAEERPQRSEDRLIESPGGQDGRGTSRVAVCVPADWPIHPLRGYTSPCARRCESSDAGLSRPDARASAGSCRRSVVSAARRRR